MSESREVCDDESELKSFTNESVSNTYDGLHGHVADGLIREGKIDEAPQSNNVLNFLVSVSEEKQKTYYRQV